MHEAARDSGLSGADLAREDDEAASLGDALEEMAERFYMALAHIEILGVRGNGEGVLLETEKFVIHRAAVQFTSSGAGTMRYKGIIRALFFQFYFIRLFSSENPAEPDLKNA